MGTDTRTLEGLDEGGAISLPCGYLDKDGVVHDVAELREMTGEDEDILAQRKLSMSQKLTLIIGNCLTKLGTITDEKALRNIAGELTIGDRIVLIMALRAVSLGMTYSFEVTCPNCKAKSSHGLRLDSLEVQVMKDKSRREFEFELPSGKRIGLRLMTAKDEERMSKFSKQRDPLSLAILARTTSLEGKSDVKLQDIKKLGLRDRNAIRDWFQKAEGGVDTDIEMECPECGEEFKSVMDIGQPDFFFPKDSELKEVSPTA